MFDIVVSSHLMKYVVKKKYIRWTTYLSKYVVASESKTIIVINFFYLLIIFSFSYFSILNKYIDSYYLCIFFWSMYVGPN